MNIGKFTKKDDGKITGKIETLTFSCDAAFFPVTDKPSAGAPDFRVYRGKGELGAAWTKQHDNVEGSYLSVKLDGPGLPGPINCALFQNTEDGSLRLVWERPEKDEQ
jgi:uncharacterized protein (DUF736 family)